MKFKKYLTSICGSILMLNSSLFFGFISSENVIYAIHFPILIGFAPTLQHHYIEKFKAEKHLEKCCVFLETSLVHIRLGRSFLDSLRASLPILQSAHSIQLSSKKNVVLQQPKSRNLKIFSVLNQDLHKVAVKKMNQKELLHQIKYKYELKLDLHQKTKVALSQYKTQSLVLFVFWFSSILFLITQNQVFKYTGCLIISFILMLAGCVLSKKLLVKSEFRI